MRWIVAVYAVSLVYAVIRYVAFAPKNAENIPVFIVNKAVAMAAVICLAWALVVQYGRRREPASPDAASWFRAGVFGAVWHVPMSLVVLRPVYFKEFFAPAVGSVSGAASGRLSFAGELVFLFGGLAAALLYLVTRQAWTPTQRWALSAAAMGALVAHVVAMGACRGLNINASHAYLPPMWLLSVVAVVVGLAAVMTARPKTG